MGPVTLAGMTDEYVDEHTDDHSDVSLRPVREEDLECFLAHEHDPEAVRRSRFTPRPREALLRHWRERVLGDPDCFVRTVTAGGRFGGYWLGRPYWARGIGTRALGLFLELEPVRPLYADPFSGNAASVRLLERHGFARAGTVRHGEDEHILLALTRPEETAR